MQKALAICASLFAVAVRLAAPCYAQDVSAADTDEARIQDVITASHILTNEGILDSFGHISARSIKNPDHFSCRAPCRRRWFPAPISSKSVSIANLLRPMRPG